MVNQNIDIPFTFWCLTDQPNVNYNTNINTISIPASSNLTVWWNKLLMFRRGFMQNQCLYFDLDVVIQGDVKCFISPAPGLTKIHSRWKDPSICKKPEEIRLRILPAFYILFLGDFPLPLLLGDLRGDLGEAVPSVCSIILSLRVTLTPSRWIVGLLKLAFILGLRPDY